MIHDLEQRGWNFLEVSLPHVHKIVFGKRQTIVFIVAGGISAVVDTSILYFSKEILRFKLVPAVATGFLFGFVVSFLLQKFWTFQDHSTERVHTQAILYFTTALINFFLTIALMYFLVEKLHFWYIASKIFVSLIIAFCTFFVYKFFIFKKVE